MEKIRHCTVFLVVLAMTGAYSVNAKEKRETLHVVGDSVVKRETTTKLLYPETRRNESVIDNCHGIQIKDPYRWLENLNSEETKAFVDVQNALTNQFLASIPTRKEINDTYRQLLNSLEQPTFPVKHGNKYYSTKDVQFAVERRTIFVQNTLEGEPSVYLDLDSFYSKNESVGILDYVFSEDSKILALMLFEGVRYSHFIRFMNTETGTMYPEILENTVDSKITWTMDGKGIFYGSNPEQAVDGRFDIKLYYHIVGTEISKDVFVAKIENPYPTDFFKLHAPLIDYGNKLLIVVKHTFFNHAIYQTKLPLDGKITEGLNLTTVVSIAKVSYSYVTNDGQNAIFLTNNNASNFQLISINLENPAKDKWTVLLPEDPDRHLDWVEAVDGDKFVACYFHYHQRTLQLHSLKTGERLKMIFLDNGSIFGHAGDKKHSEFSFGFKSLSTSGIIYTMDLTKDQEPEIARQSQADKLYHRTHKTTQVFYPSKDGTRVPMIIVTKANTFLDGSAPTFLFPGGYLDGSMFPHLIVQRRLLTQHFNGVWAMASTRGTNDFIQNSGSSKWEEDGLLMKAQNAFDDLQYAAKYLIENNYTTASKLVIIGSGQKGLDVAACINQRPDLFGAAVIENGLLDMLRYHKLGDEGWTNGYGSPDDAQHFVNLLKYSPLHNVKSPPDGSQFPATLFMISEDRPSRPPLETFKMTATLQHYYGKLVNQTNPILARIETGTGHGPSTDQIDEGVDYFSFLVKTLSLTFKK